MSAQDPTTSLEVREIPGFPGYGIDRLGGVYSCWKHGYHRIIPGRWHPRKTHITHKGYLRVGLLQGDRQRHFMVHHLVLLAWVGPRPEGMDAAHNDGNKLNNDVANLRYDTRKGNLSDRAIHGTLLNGSRSRLAKLTEADVIEIRQLRAGGMTLQAIGDRFGTDFSNIGHIVSRKTWKHI